MKTNWQSVLRSNSRGLPRWAWPRSGQLRHLPGNSISVRATHSATRKSTGHSPLDASHPVQIDTSPDSRDFRNTSLSQSLHRDLGGGCEGGGCEGGGPVPISTHRTTRSRADNYAARPGAGHDSVYKQKTNLGKWQRQELLLFRCRSASNLPR